MTVHDDDVPPSEQPALDELLAALRQPARPDELVGEREAVAAVGAALASSRGKGPVPLLISSRLRRLTAVAAAVVLIVGGVTAAAAAVMSGPSGPSRIVIPSQTPSSTSSTSTSSTSSSTSTSTTSTTEPSSTTTEPSTSSSEPETTSSVPGGTTATSVACPEGAENHGEAVSQVAHSVEPGPGHGEAVSQIAQSDCGKNGGDEADNEDDNSTPPATAATNHAHDNNDDQGDKPGGEHKSGATASINGATNGQGGDNRGSANGRD
jgi:hypothetical protein